MCTFIAIASRDLDSVKSMLTGYTIYPAENASLRRLLPENYAWSWLTDGHCACSLHIEPYDVDAEIAKIRSKYSKPKFRKRGWNERRIEDKIAGLKKTRVTDTGGLASGLLDSFFEVVRAKADLHFVINFFSGDQNKETVSVFKDVTDRPNGTTHVRLNGATCRVDFHASEGVIISPFWVLFQGVVFAPHPRLGACGNFCHQAPAGKRHDVADQGWMRPAVCWGTPHPIR